MNTKSQLTSVKERWRSWYMKIPFYSKYREIINKNLKALFKNFPTFVKFAFAKSNKEVIYVAFRPEGGFGDILRQKAILIEIIKMFPNVIIDIYHDKAYHLLNDIKNIRFVFKDKHSLNITKKFYNISFSQYEDKFNLFVKFVGKGEGGRLFSRIKNNLSRYNIDYPSVFSGLENKFYLDGKVIDYTVNCKLIQQKANNTKHNTINYIKMFKIISGVDNVEDDKLQLLFKEQSLSKFCIFKGTKYLTIQCGQGVTGDFSGRGWDIGHWEEFVTILKKGLDRDINIVQVGLTKLNLKGVDYNLNAVTTLEELWTVLKHSILHIDLDGACVHFARIVNTKSVVLWWLENPSFISYPENINITSDDGNVNSIPSDYVAQKVIEYLTSEKNL
ncbi:MAG: hypothetical protein LBB44_01045 [Endomicrobium sp.]|nr:hypothetical protein [Endomicrobium sp.]